MKQKTHSGTKKRVKVRAGGKLMVDKAAKRHLLVNKSKRQKSAFPSGMPVTTAHMKAIRRLLPGKVNLKKLNK